VLLALVLIPGIGREVNGARRWLPLGIVNLQPSELMKLFAVLYAADYTARKMPHMHDLKKAFLPLASAMVAVGILLLKEPDFGAFVVIISIAMGILFPRRHAGASVRHPDPRPGRRLCRADHLLTLPA
jgi:cell division protein FtsW